MSRALAIVLAALAGCGAQKAEPPTAKPAQGPPSWRVVDVDDNSYQRVVKEAERPVLALFWAPWSEPDRIVIAYLDEAARERPGLTVARIDVDEAPDAARRHEILSIPTTMVLVDGRQRGESVVGAAPKQAWEKKLDLDAVASRR